MPKKKNVLKSLAVRLLKTAVDFQLQNQGLIINNPFGIWLLANKGCLSQYQLVQKIIGYAALNKELLVPVYHIQVYKMPAFPSRKLKV